jgi:hypothetical protein
MKTKTFSLRVNDLFDELKDENKRLLKQLLFAERKIKVLEKFRNHLNNFRIYCCNENIVNKLNFQDLENEYQLVSNNQNQEIIVQTNDDIISEEIETNSREICPQKLIDWTSNSSLKRSIKRINDLYENESKKYLKISVIKDQPIVNYMTTDPKNSESVKKSVNNYSGRASAREEFLKVQVLEENEFVLGINH